MRGPLGYGEPVWPLRNGPRRSERRSQGGSLDLAATAEACHDPQGPASTRQPRNVRLPFPAGRASGPCFKELSPAVGPSKPRLLRVLGPCLITGAADDNPRGIATYGQAWAQLGYNLSWTMLYNLPLVAAVQMVSARVARTTGHGIAETHSRALVREINTGRSGVRCWPWILDLNQSSSGVSLKC
jgi:hypothetical protein